MKIRINSLPKLQMGGSPLIGDDIMNQQFYQENPMTPGRTLNTGIGPNGRPLDEADRMYQTDPRFERRYDRSLNQYHKQNPYGQDADAYRSFYSNKYPPSDFLKYSNMAGDISDGIQNTALLAGSLAAPFQDAADQRDWNRHFRNQQFNGPAIQGGDRGDYMTNDGIFRPDEQGPVNKGRYTNQFYPPMNFEEGGETKLMKIRITNKMAYGGQRGYALDLKSTDNIFPDSMTDNPSKTVSQQEEDPDKPYVLEAEDGETILRPDGSHFRITGDSHAKGGEKLTAEQAPEGSFIYSKKLKEKRPEVLDLFNKLDKKNRPLKKGGFSYADLAKPLDLNKYKAILEDRDADPLSKKTAQMMIDKYQDKLSMLALAQESAKGFPTGIPDVAKLVMPPEMIEQMTASLEGQAGTPPPVMAYGGTFQFGGPRVEEAYQLKYPWLKPWMKSNTLKGRTTPTGESSIYRGDPNVYQDLGYWEKQAGRNFNSLEDLQRHIYTTMEQEDPSAIREMWDTWGHTAKSKQEDVGGFGDRIMGARTARSLKWRVPTKAAPRTPGTTMWVCTPQGVKAVPGSAMVPGMPSYATQAEAEAACNQKTPPAGPNDVGTTPPKQEPFDFMWPDKRRMFTSRLMPPKKTLPYYADVNAITPSPVFEDWRAKAGARQSMYNTGVNTLGTYQSPTSLAANSSFMAGQQGEGLIQDIAGVEGRNVNTANQFADRQAQILNTTNSYNAVNKDRRYQGNTIANQQYQNSMREFIKNIDQTDIDAWKNRSSLGMVNSTNPYYYMDPTSGRTVFKGGMGPDKLGMDNGTGFSLANHRRYIQEGRDADMSPEWQQRYAAIRSGLAGNRSTMANQMYAAQDMTQFYNPFLQ